MIKTVDSKDSIVRELTDAAAYKNRQTLRVHSPGGSTFLRELTSWPPTWKRKVK